MIVPLNPQQSGLMKEASRAVEKPSLCRVKKGEPAAGRPSKCFPLTSAHRILRHIYKDWCPRTFWLLMSSKHSEAVWLVFLSSLQLYWKVSLFYQWIHDYRPWIQDHHPSRLMTTSPLVFPSFKIMTYLETIDPTRSLINVLFSTSKTGQFAQGSGAALRPYCSWCSGYWLSKRGRDGKWVRAPTSPSSRHCWRQSTRSKSGALRPFPKLLPTNQTALEQYQGMEGNGECVYQGALKPTPKSQKSIIGDAHNLNTTSSCMSLLCWEIGRDVCFFLSPSFLRYARRWEDPGVWSPWICRQMAEFLRWREWNLGFVHFIHLFIHVFASQQLSLHVHGESIALDFLFEKDKLSYGKRDG